MSRVFVSVILLVCLIGIGIYFATRKHQAEEAKVRISLADVMTNRNSKEFARAVTPRKFVFPDDLGAHSKFQTEWWYYTGNLQTEQGRHFGFQFTIFRNAIDPNSIKRSSAWATNQIYMGHFAMTDVEDKKFYAFERLSRGANQLAGAQSKPFRVWLEDWKVGSTKKDTTNPVPNMKIQAAENGISINLDLQNTKPVVLHGDRGLSQKGAEPGNASYYYSLTRMIVGGQIQINDNTFKVTGLAWLDREWSTSALAKDQVGWDWFSLQLDDGREIMYYQIRKRDGQPNDHSSGTLIQKNGTTRHLKLDDILLEVLAHWTSPRGRKYPSSWRIEIPSEKLNLEITPYLPDQELNLSIRYWEGAVKIEGLSNGKKIQGNGYVELTGYGDLKRQ